MQPSLRQTPPRARFSITRVLRPAVPALLGSIVSGRAAAERRIRSIYHFHPLRYRLLTCSAGWRSFQGCVFRSLRNLEAGAAVNSAVIVGQRQTHSRIGLDFAVYLADAGGDGVNTENAGLRSVDNRGEALNTEGAEVGDGEGGALTACRGLQRRFWQVVASALGLLGDLVKRLHVLAL